MDTLRQTMQAEQQKALEKIQEATAATIASVRATFLKEMKAQLAITLAETRNMMNETVKTLLAAHQQELAKQRTEMFDGMRTMLSQIMRGETVESSLDGEHEGDSVKTRKRRLDETEGAVATQSSTLGTADTSTQHATQGNSEVAPLLNPCAGPSDDMDTTNSTDSVIFHPPSPSLPTAPPGGGGDGN
jgi:hypothetical protein